MESIDILKKSKTFSRTGSQDFSNIMYGKLPPQARELEEAVIGALLIDKEALNEVIDILKPEVFYVEAHKIIFNAINQLFDKSEPIDLLTVAQQVRKNGELELIGGAYEDTTDVLELLDKAEKNIFSVAEQNLKRGSNTMKGLLADTMEEINEIRNKESGLVGVPSGFTHLDAVTGGWQKSDLVIIAARPAMGKTAFVLNIARTAAVDYNMPVAVFSLEMSGTQLVKRLIATETEIDASKIHQGNLTDNEWNILSQRSERLANAPIFINDTPGLNIFEFRAQCRRLKSAHDIQLVVIDYLQLMSGNSDGKGSTREQEISSISRALKGIAKELNIPVLALSQLSRAVESRTGEKKPQLSDLRESGAIEQDADMVIGLYRPEYYGYEQDSEGESTKGLTEIIIMKNRHGSVTTVKLEFVKEFTKFRDWNQYSHQLSGYSQQHIGSGGGFNNPGTGFQTLPSRMNENENDGGDEEDLF